MKVTNNEIRIRQIENVFPIKGFYSIIRYVTCFFFFFSRIPRIYTFCAFYLRIERNIQLYEDKGSRALSARRTWNIGMLFVESRTAYLARFDDGIKARDFVVMCLRATYRKRFIGSTDASRRTSVTTLPGVLVSSFFFYKTRYKKYRVIYDLAVS